MNKLIVAAAAAGLMSLAACGEKNAAENAADNAAATK